VDAKHFEDSERDLVQSIGAALLPIVAEIARQHVSHSWNGSTIGKPGEVGSEYPFPYETPQE
jgi:hypothetical protein